MENPECEGKWSSAIAGSLLGRIYLYRLTDDMFIALDCIGRCMSRYRVVEQKQTRTDSNSSALALGAASGWI